MEQQQKQWQQATRLPANKRKRDKNIVNDYFFLPHSLISCIITMHSAYSVVVIVGCVGLVLAYVKDDQLHEMNVFKTPACHYTLMVPLLMCIFCLCIAHKRLDHPNTFTACMILYIYAQLHTCTLTTWKLKPKQFLFLCLLKKCFFFVFVVRFIFLVRWCVEFLLFTLVAAANTLSLFLLLLYIFLTMFLYVRLSH